MSVHMQQAAMAANSGLPSAGRIQLEDSDPPVISHETVYGKMEEEGDKRILRLTSIRRRFPLVAKEDFTDETCARLPSEYTDVDEAEWAEIVPSETYREICLGG